LSIEPAMFGTRATRTMFAALYGELVLHPRHDPPDDLSQDAYSLFYARSAAMGWLTPSVENASGGFWGMNDAEAGPGSGPQPSRVAWFQVGLTEPAPVSQPLPVEAFLSCAADVVARLGALRLQAVQILLPEQEVVDGQPASPSGMRVASPLLAAANWFADCDPNLRAPVQVTLDGGSDPSIRAAAPAILQRVRAIRQEVFVCDSFSLADDDHLVLRPAVMDEGRPGTAHHRATFRGTLAEWSLDALGWLAAFLADASSRQGVSTPLMLTASPSAGQVRPPVEFGDGPTGTWRLVSDAGRRGGYAP
jgi:hypothetical protein